MLLSSHLLADVEDVCDRIAMLYRGRLQLEGRVDELLETGAVTEVAVSGLSDSGIEAVRAEAVRQGGQVLGAHRRRERLEALFLRVVERERGKQE